MSPPNPVSRQVVEDALDELHANLEAANAHYEAAPEDSAQILEATTRALQAIVGCLSRIPGFDDFPQGPLGFLIQACVEATNGRTHRMMAPPQRPGKPFRSFASLALEAFAVQAVDALISKGMRVGKASGFVASVLDREARQVGARASAGTIADWRKRRKNKRDDQSLKNTIYFVSGRLSIPAAMSLTEAQWHIRAEAHHRVRKLHFFRIDLGDEHALSGK